jgi:hypothetical protein
MLRIGESAAAVEAQIDDARRETGSDRKRELLSPGRAAHRIAELDRDRRHQDLSNEVTDSAWAAYLKGDRGVFTRRAVRLIDNSEARSILQHYENEPEFREQVNRYVHDFEAMLRRILTDRDSSALGVTILSLGHGQALCRTRPSHRRLSEAEKRSR